MVKNKDNNWNKLYDDYISKEYKNWNEYFAIKMKLKNKFLKQVQKHSNNKPVLECGCGTGKFAAYLASLGIKSYAMDLEQEMVEKTNMLSEKLTLTNPVIAIKGDIRQIPYENGFFSVAHSSGVYEHYSDNEIINIINEQLRVADTVVFSVPSQYFEKKMYGDERFLNRKMWRQIIEKSDAKIIHETGYHYKIFSKRLLDIIKNPKIIFKPIALYVFTLKRKNDN